MKKNLPGGAFLLGLSLLGFMALAYGYAKVFGQFASYDDEGTMLLSIVGFLEGRELYEEVLMPYGPGYYLLAGAAFSIIEPTTNQGRLLVLGVGLILVILSMLIAWGISRSKLLTLTAAPVASVLAFTALAPEPVHPLSVTMVCSLGLVATVVVKGRLRSVARGVIAGTVLALLVLTKINIGVFLCAAVLFSLLVLLGNSRSNPVKWILGLGLVLLPWLIANRQLLSVDREEGVGLVFLLSVSALSLVIASIGWGGNASEGDRKFGLGWGLGVLGGAMAAGGAVLGGFLLIGGDFFNLWNELVVQAARLGATFFIPIALPFGVIGLAAVGVSLCAFLTTTKAGTQLASSSLFLAWAKIGSGAVIIASLMAFTVGFNAAIAFPLILAWISVVPGSGSSVRGMPGIARFLIPAVAVFGAFGIYPVSGSQVPGAALLFLPTAILCLSDGLKELGGQGLGDRFELRSLNTIDMMKVVVLSWVSSLFFVTVVIAVANYRGGKVPVTGVADASRVRLDPFEASELGKIVEAVKTSRCSSLFTYPTKGSLVLWSGLGQESPMSLGNWPWLITEKDQKDLVESAQAGRRPCLLRQPAFLETPGSICAEGSIWSQAVTSYLCGRHGNIRTLGEWAGGRWELLIKYPRKY